MKVLIATLLFVLACNAETFSLGDSVMKITKDRAPRVDGLDRLLFNLDEYEYLNPQLIKDLEHETMSRGELETLLAFSIGPEWQQLVELPEEDLSMIEALRLASNLNEMNLKYYNSVNGKATRSYSSGSGYESGESGAVQGFCYCHGTARRWPCEGYGAQYGTQYPFMGIRMFKAGAFIPNSFSSGNFHGESGHHYQPYHNDYRDCLLANEVTDPYLAQNVRRCCHGFCVLTGEGSPVDQEPGTRRWASAESGESGYNNGYSENNHGYSESESGYNNGYNNGYSENNHGYSESESGYNNGYNNHGNSYESGESGNAPYTLTLDTWCEGPNDSDYILQANRYHCQKNCHLEACSCNELLGAYSYKHCGCDEEFLEGVCECEDAIAHTHCNCKERIDIIADETSCGCFEAIEAQCTDCDQTIQTFYHALQCDCDDHFEYIDNTLDCSCAEGAEYMCNNCCQVFNILEDNDQECERITESDSHAAYLAGCCVDGGVVN